MTTSEKGPSTAAVPSLAWGSLIRRSVQAWQSLAQNGRAMDREMLQEYIRALQECANLDEFLGGGSDPLMFWFFQRREAFLSQGTMTEWNRHRLDDYILLPAAEGIIQRSECLFISHYWQTKSHPDPDGQRLRLHQEELQSQTWSYIWVDWTCIPQSPRSKNEEAYFLRTLQTVSALVRNCGFLSSYPSFEARMWILYEVAERILTSKDFQPSEDMKEFAAHTKEMLQIGVPSTLKKHGYRCTSDRGQEFLTSALEILVLLTRLRVGSDEVKRLLDSIAWYPSTAVTFSDTAKGLAMLSRYEGKLILGGECYTFTPFPKWDENECSPISASGSRWAWQSIKDWLT